MITDIYGVGIGKIKRRQEFLFGIKVIRQPLLHTQDFRKCIPGSLLILVPVYGHCLQILQNIEELFAGGEAEVYPKSL